MKKRERKVKLINPLDLKKLKEGEKISLVFNNLQIYTGIFVELDNENENDVTIILRSAKGNCGGFPMNRLIGWFKGE